MKEFAEAAEISTPHLSHVINGGEPGSLKTLRDCLRAMEIDIEACLIIPPQGDDEKRERYLVERYRVLIPKDKTTIIGLAESLAEKVLGPKQSGKAGKR